MTSGKLPETCRAVTLIPGTAGSARLDQVAVESPAAGQALVRVRAVGICGTDAEILAGLYGAAPPGHSRLVPGHESLLEVVATADNDPAWPAGQLAVAIVRQPCPERCPPCAAGRWDYCRTGHYREHGIKEVDGFLREYAVIDTASLIPLPNALAQSGVLVEPLSVVEKAVGEAYRVQSRLPWNPQRALVTGAGPIGLLATWVLASKGLEVWTVDRVAPDSPKAQLVTAVGAHYLADDVTPLESVAGDGFDLALEATGYAPLLFRAQATLRPDGILVLTGVTGGHRTIEVDANLLNRELVLENHTLLGSVNAAREHYLAAVNDLAAWHRRYGDLPLRLITRRLPLERFADALEKTPETVKNVVEVTAP